MAFNIFLFLNFGGFFFIINSQFKFHNADLQNTTATSNNESNTNNGADACQTKLDIQTHTHIHTYMYTHTSVCPEAATAHAFVGRKLRGNQMHSNTK